MNTASNQTQAKAIISHEEAVKFIMPHLKSENKAESTAADYAINDILFDGIDQWLNTPTYKLIDKFVSNGLELLEDYMCEIFTDEDKQRAFADDAINIAEAMYHYTFLHCKLKGIKRQTKI